jgi:hypothetical protein
MVEWTRCPGASSHIDIRATATRAMYFRMAVLGDLHRFLALSRTKGFISGRLSYRLIAHAGSCRIIL